MKTTILTILLTILCLGTANAQKPMKVKANPETSQVSREPHMPSFPGGKEALMQYLAGNVKYPKDAYEQKIGGRVLVQFVIEKDGSISDVEIARGVFPSLDEEAIRVIKGMPRWNPGKQNGKAVRVKYVLPVSFRPQ